MNIFKVNKVIHRLDEMIEHAINGDPIENIYDETKMASLESKLSQYLQMTQTSKKQLEEEKNQIKELISDISHQTKTPIANILLYAQLLSESEQNEENKALIEALLLQGEKLQFLIEVLIKSSRLETGIIVVNPEINKVAVLLDEVQKQVATDVVAKEIDLTIEVGEETALFDLKWTREAIYNIVHNAIKYTPAGGRVKVSVTAFELFCKIYIKDNGIGISEEEHNKVFARFYRSQAVRHEEGLGIGLFLAREIITKQGGYIKLKSAEGKGATFSVYLPQR